MTELRDVMLDLETMGTEAGCPIVAIGAVMFDPRTSEIGDSFYQLITLDSCISRGMTLCADTVLWWMRQGDAARGQICRPDLERADLADALIDFAMWLPNNAIVWGNGSDFDNVILEAGFRAVNQPVPWKYWNNRCYRTVKSLKPSIELEREGTHHNALHDAISQAKHLQKILGGRK